MNRRQFLRMAGSGVVATATMAEAGMLAKIWAWLCPRPGLSYDQMTATTMKYIVPRLADNVFKSTPVFVKLRQYGYSPVSSVVRIPVPGPFVVKEPRDSIELFGIS